MQFDIFEIFEKIRENISENFKYITVTKKILHIKIIENKFEV